VGPTKNRLDPLCISMMQETEKVSETLDFNSELTQLITQEYSSFLVAMKVSSFTKYLLL
jgi:hypothetical protein